MAKAMLRSVLSEPVRYYLRRIVSLRGQVFPSVIPYEPQVQLAMQAQMRPGDIVFDVGAHVGLHTIVMARLVGAEGHVHCFEANPGILGKLRRTLRANGVLERCTVVHGAVTDMGGTSVTLFVDKGPRMEGAASTIMPYLAGSRRMGKGVEQRRVSTISLDEYCEATGVYPRFVKMDIEGAEFLALKGFEKVLRTRMPGLVLEYGNAGASSPGDPNQALTFLAEIGYELFDLDSGHMIDAAKYSKRDIFCYVLASNPEARASSTAAKLDIDASRCNSDRRSWY